MLGVEGVIQNDIDLLMSDDTKTDSEDEELFQLYLEELKSIGIITNWSRCNSVSIFDGVKAEREEVKKDLRYKKEVKIIRNHEVYNLLQSKEYTADYLIIWNPAWKDVIFHDFEDVHQQTLFIAKREVETHRYFSVVDVKPSANIKFIKFTSTQNFAHNQALFFNKWNIVVQKIKIKDLFKESFTPTVLHKRKSGRYKIDDFLSSLQCKIK